MWKEGRIRDAARRRHGLIGRPELLSIGASDHEIAQRVTSGRLEQLHPGVYYLDAAPATWKTDVLAGVMAAGPDALASHRTAAVLWGFDAIQGRMIDVTVPYNEEPEPQGVILHRTRRPNPGRVVDGIPITPPEKAIMDLWPMVPEKVFQKAMRSAIRQRLTTVQKMDRAIGFYGGRGVDGTRGTRKVLSIVSDDMSGSVAEIDLKDLALGSPIPPPVQQYRIRLPDGTNAYLDLAWPNLMKYAEADGFIAHSTPEQLQNDLTRQNYIMDLGWEGRRFTAAEIRERPEQVKQQLIRFINGS